MSWTKDEEAFLVENYSTLGPTKCAIALCKTFDSVSGRARKLNLKKARWNKFTIEQDLFIFDNADKGSKYIADSLSLPIHSIQNRAAKLGIKIGSVGKSWTEDEINFLVENYAILGPTECAKQLNRTIKAVERKGDSLNLRVYKSWSLEEDNLIKKYYPSTCSIQLAKKLNRSLSAILNRAHKLNIQKEDSIDKNNSDCYLYIIFIPYLNLFKVGISTNPYNRFSTFKYPIIIKSLLYGNYKEIEKFEEYLLNFIADYKVNTGLLPSGNTETYRF
jgi:hypothetical protein